LDREFFILEGLVSYLTLAMLGGTGDLETRYYPKMAGVYGGKIIIG
jgi:hypothetical protein